MLKFFLGIIGFTLTFLKANCLEAQIFEIHPLSEELRQEMSIKQTWKEGCPISLNRLKILKRSYYDFEGHEHDDGEMVVLDAASEHVLEIFKELYDLKFPFSKILR